MRTARFLISNALAFVAMQAFSPNLNARTHNSRHRHSSAGSADPNNVHLTGYSASCKYDKEGGRNASASGASPRSHTLDGPSKNGVILVAVPDLGGTSNLYGCVLNFDFPPSVPKYIRKQFANKTIFAGDHYGVASRGQMKIDVSHACTPAVQDFNFSHVKVEKVYCPGEQWARAGFPDRQVAGVVDSSDAAD